MGAPDIPSDDVLALALLLLARPDQLIKAVSAGNLETASALLAAGADPDSSDGDGETALIYAAFENRPDIAAVLLGSNARVGLTWGGSTALDFAVSRGSLETARLLIDNGADVRRVYPSGRTPLHIATRNYHTEVAALLIDRGAEVDAQDNSGATPLLEAVGKGMDDLVKLLLDAGADPLRKNNAGIAPIEAAASKGRADLTRALLATVGHPPEELLTLAIHKDYLDIVATLLTSGMDGSPALHDAALKGRVDMLKVLLAKGADVNHKTNTGATPLHDAAIGGHVEAVRILLEHGANVNARETESGDTPLYMAAAMGRDQVAALLLEKGADPNLGSKEGGTPLHAAVTNGFTKVAEILRVHAAK